MCDICDTARKQPKSKALGIVAIALANRRIPRGRECIDKLVGELVGVAPTGQDALDHTTQPLKERP